MRPKTFKVIAAIIFTATLFINGMLLTFSFGFGKPPQSWFLFITCTLAIAALVAMVATYFMMINPDWQSSKEELDAERIEVAEQRKELIKLRQRYENFFEHQGNADHRASIVGIHALESMPDIVIPVDQLPTGGKFNSFTSISMRAADLASLLRADIGYNH